LASPVRNYRNSYSCAWWRSLGLWRALTVVGFVAAIALGVTQFAHPPAPPTAPIVVDLGRTTGRYVRLTQTGAEPGIPWWIPDIHVHAPVIVDAR